MHPELLSALVAERRRDIDAAVAARAKPCARAGARTGRRPRALARRLVLVPRFRVYWTRVTLAAVSGGRRGGSVVIVISATRAPAPADRSGTAIDFRRLTA